MLLGWMQEDLAAHSGASIPTVKRLESGSRFRVSDEAKAKIEAALEAAGIEFTNGDAPGVRRHKRDAVPISDAGISVSKKAAPAEDGGASPPEEKGQP